MILSLSGYKGSGKNTVADYISQHYGFANQISFASTVKDILSTLFGWNRVKLDGLAQEDRNWRNQIDYYWSRKIGYDFTPNIAMKEFGTDVMRKWIPDIWVSIVEKKLLQLQNSPIIVTDTRFENEYEMLRNNGAIIVGIIKKTDKVFTHESDTTWLNFKLDYTLNNEKTFSELYTECDMMMTSFGIPKIA